MGVDVLPGWIAALGLPATTVLVCRESEVPDDADQVWCVLVAGGGAAGEAADGPAWDVFWLERGQRWSWTRFDEESAACFHLLGRLAWSQMMRGVLRVA